jgi:FkbM family methyltransferase
MLGGRPPRLIVRSIAEPDHYVALARMVRLYPAFPRVAKRYFVGGGRYPYACRVRTPTGLVSPLLYSHHDVFTIHEIFGREDYRAGPDLGVAVDIGSNIGISALYFLTRNRVSRCYLYEPVPRNTERLRRNLASFESRYSLEEVAVAADEGIVDFTIEPTGRYGGIGVSGTDRIVVPCRAIADVVASVLEREGEIDLLKIDIEGAEIEAVKAIPEAQLARIRTICFETTTPLNPDPVRFDLTFACETCRLDRRSATPALRRRPRRWAARAPRVSRAGTPRGCRGPSPPT